MSNINIKIGNQLRGSAGKFRPMHLLLAGNDTVPISVWRGGGVRSIVCRLVIRLEAKLRANIGITLGRNFWRCSRVEL